MLFDRSRQGTTLLSAGVVFLQDVRRLFAILEQARENVQATTAGLRGSLRIAIFDGATDPRLSAFLAHSRIIRRRGFTYLAWLNELASRKPISG